MSWRLAILPSQLDAFYARLEDPTLLEGITEEDRRVWLFFRTHADALAIAQWSGGQPEFVADENWCAAWQADWRPFTLGQRWFLVPSDADTQTPPVETPPGRLRLTMQPGTVFGGGDHPTTQACLLLMEQVLRPGMRVLDIGSGTGILSAAAKALGAEPVFACDLEAPAAQASNTVAFAWQGSTTALGDTRFDAILANLSPGTLEALTPEMKRLSKPEAIWIWSGFLPEQQDWIQQAAGRNAQQILERDGWAAAIFHGPSK